MLNRIFHQATSHPGLDAYKLALDTVDEILNEAGNRHIRQVVDRYASGEGGEEFLDCFVKVWEENWKDDDNEHEEAIARLNRVQGRKLMSLVKKSGVNDLILLLMGGSLSWS